MENTKNVLCIKWGNSDYYSAGHVNNLFRSVRENTKYEVNFYCFTDNAEGLDGGIAVKALPMVRNLDRVGCNIYQKEVGLCSDDLAGLEGQRVLYFDLDTVVVDNIDSFFELPKNDEFYIIEDWSHRNGLVGQASCYSWVVGTVGHVKSYFEEFYGEVYRTFGTASQEYLSSKIMEKYGKLNFWPRLWCRSFKFHCLPNPLIPLARRLKVAQIPANSKIICFHGRPKPDDALKGIWPERSFYKRVLYKHLRPVSWLSKYWKVQ
ncbi:MAG: hypothetical protein LBB13_01670 [Rickettsiales bacterium]|jgi:hypothetical protein|nr:hypothetical protein [Rickettsiales bacterium]